ncbi:Hydrophobic protein RCI2A, partial [Cucurbita argyrosperma subsp. argyrosperma]
MGLRFRICGHTHKVFDENPQWSNVREKLVRTSNFIHKTPNSKSATRVSLFSHVNRERIMGSETFVEIILAILLPPLGVFLRYGCGVEFWICLLLTILGYIPGIIYAIYVLSCDIIIDMINRIYDKIYGESETLSLLYANNKTCSQWAGIFSQILSFQQKTPTEQNFYQMKMNGWDGVGSNPQDCYTLEQQLSKKRKHEVSKPFGFQISSSMLHFDGCDWKT